MFGAILAGLRRLEQAYAVSGCPVGEALQDLDTLPGPQTTEAVSLGCFGTIFSVPMVVDSTVLDPMQCVHDVVGNNKEP